MLVVIVGAGLAVAAGGPKVVAPKEPVGEKEEVVLTMTSSAPIAIDGCVPVEFERRAAELWEPVTTTPCNTTVPATRVVGSLTLSSPPMAAGEYRAVVGWGSGCTDGQAFHLAGCRKLGFVRSEPFRVGQPPPEPVPADATPSAKAPGVVR